MVSKATAVVKTKLYCPQETGDFVLRRRLLEALDASLERPLTLVSAPAGYGKSVLVSDWTRCLATPVAWIVLDKAESELSQFLAYLTSALNSTYPGAFDSTWHWLATRELPSLQFIARELINKIDSVEKPVVLVLDDYHQIDHGSVVHELLGEILKHPPANFHLLLVTRRDPPLALTKLKANNQLIELRQADLRFDEAEAAKMLSAAWGELSESAWIHDLQEAAEGWAVGLRMIALAARHPQISSRPPLAIPAGLHRIHEYLLQEVIKELDPGFQYMLYCAAVPEKFCAGLLDSLVELVPDEGRSDGDDKLNGAEFIHRAQLSNMFIIPLDASGTWYRWHHLFRELLLAELQDRLPAEKLALIQTKVASSLEELGIVDGALRAYIHSGNYREAAEVVDRHRVNALDEDLWWQVSGWLRLFPADEVRKWPGTLFARAWIGQFNMDLELISDLVQQMEILDKNSGLTKSQLGELDFFRSVSLLLSGDIAGARKMCEKASSAPLGYGTIKGELEASLAVTRAMDGVPELALKGIQKVKVLDAGKRGALATRLAAAELYVHYMTLDTVAASRSAARLAMISSSDFDSIYARGWANFMQGLVLFNTGRFQEALVVFGRAKESERDLESRTYIDLLAGKVICLTWLEEWENLDIALSELESLSVSIELEVLKAGVLASVAARSALMRADLESAIAIALNLPELPEAFNLLFWLEEPAITRIRVSLARGKLSSTRVALKSIRATREGTYCQGLLCQDLDLMLLEAVAREQLDQREEALALLSEALDHAVPARWSRPFMELGVLLIPLLQHSTLSEEHLEFLSYHCKLEGAARPESPGQAKMDDRDQSADMSREQLTNRELDILELLAKRFRNKEIASQLYMSTHTVNYHLKHIYQKLDVSGRRMAVSRAIELGIITD